jgi:hypothetical protein
MSPSTIEQLLHQRLAGCMERRGSRARGRQVKRHGLGAREDVCESATVARWRQPHGYFGKGPRECTGRSRSRVTNHVTFRAHSVRRSCPKVPRCTSRHNRRVAPTLRKNQAQPEALDPNRSTVLVLVGTRSSLHDVTCRSSPDSDQPAARVPRHRGVFRPDGTWPGVHLDSVNLFGRDRVHREAPFAEVAVDRWRAQACERRCPRG